MRPVAEARADPLGAEFEMKAMLNRIRMRDLVVFVAVAGIVAVAALFAVREAGVGGGGCCRG